MNCERIQELLQERLDGELAGRDRAEVDRHLGGCPTCRRVLGELEALAATASRLPRGIDPGRDLWPGIEARLRSGARPPVLNHGRHQHFRWGWLAAAAALLVLVGLPLVLQLERRWQPSEPVAVRVVQAAPSGFSPGEVEAKAGLARSEDGTQHSRTDLEVSVELQRDVWSDEVVADLEENLRILDVAVAELRRALDEDPWNRKLNHLLAARYQQEAELAQRMRRI
jgi:anti-sigma factor RsiW